MEKNNTFSKALNFMVITIDLGLSVILYLAIFLAIAIVVLAFGIYLSLNDNRNAYDRFFNYPTEKIRNLETEIMHNRGLMWARFESTEVIFPADFGKPYKTIQCKKSYVALNCAVLEKNIDSLEDGYENLLCWQNLDNNGFQKFIFNQKTGKHYFCYNNFD